MIDLVNLAPQTISRDLKGKYVFAFGPAKIGKTTLLASFDKALILSFEPGSNALANAFVQPITTWSEFKTVLRDLKKPQVKEKFDFVGIDTLDIAYDLAEAYICKSYQVETLADVPYGGAYSALKKEVSKTFREIAQLGYGIIFISHSIEKTKKDYLGKEYTQIIPAAPSKASEIANKLVDFIIYIGLEYSKEYPQGKRFMQLKETKEIFAGSRFDVPQRIEFGYESLRDAIYEAIDKAAKTQNAKVVDTQENFYKETESRSFEECFEEAKTIWTKIIELDNSNEMAITLNTIVEKNFNRKMKLSQVTKQQQEVLEVTIEDLKELLESIQK